MIDVGQITPCELFKMICTGTGVADFNDIIFKASGETSEVIQVDFNKNICIANENYYEFKAWRDKKRKADTG